MGTWMRRVFSSEGATECPPGPNLERLRKKFQRGGAVYFCLDVSYSMAGNIPAAVRGGESFLEVAHRGGYSTGVVLWHGRVAKMTALSRDIRSALEVLRSAKAGGGTDVLPALEAASKELLQSSEEDKVIAVFGDGDLGRNREEAVSLSRDLASQGIRIITMGLGSSSADALSDIATENYDGETNVATSNTLAEDISGMSRGLRRRKQN